MGRALLLFLIALVSVDLTTLDAPRLFAGGRAVQWDDEEESAPTRRTSVRGKERRAIHSPAAPQPVAALPQAPRVARATSLASRARQPVWLVPIRNAVAVSHSSASPPEDH